MAQNEAAILVEEGAGHAAEGGGSGLNIHPMDQFVVSPLFGAGEVHWYTPTNATLWMALTVACVVGLLVILFIPAERKMLIKWPIIVKIRKVRLFKKVSTSLAQWRRG